MSLLNEASWDRIVRVLLGLAGLIVWWTGSVSSGLGWVALIVGVILLATGLVGWCPLYSVLRIRTLRREGAPDA